MNELHISLPFGFRAGLFAEIPEPYFSQAPYHHKKKGITPATFFFKRNDHQAIRCGIQQVFFMKLSPEFKSLKESFVYHWDMNKGRVIIKKYLANTDLQLISDSLNSLLVECKMFYLMNGIDNEEDIIF